MAADLDILNMRGGRRLYASPPSATRRVRNVASRQWRRTDAQSGALWMMPQTPTRRQAHERIRQFVERENSSGRRFDQLSLTKFILTNQAFSKSRDRIQRQKSKLRKNRNILAFISEFCFESSPSPQEILRAGLDRLRAKRTTR